MNSSDIKKKKISEYQISDIKELFSDILKKISSKIILLEIGNEFLNIGLAKYQGNKLYIKKIFREELPKDALDKSIPSDPVNFGIFLSKILELNKINTNRIALTLSSDACYTRLLEIPEDITEEDAADFIKNPKSDIQIPISLNNSDYEIRLTNLPKKERRKGNFNQYFLTSIPKKNIDIVLDSIKKANLEICSVQMSHMCIANLLRTEIEKLNDNQLIISVDLLDEFTQIIIFDSSGPILIKRLASIRNYPSIEDLKIINKNKTGLDNKSKETNNNKNYHALSKLDLKILLREVSETFNEFLTKYELKKEGKIFLTGRNSQHENLVELIGENLNIDVSLISPINYPCLREFAYNPDELNQFSMSRIIGLGLTLIKEYKLEDEFSSGKFIFKSFSVKEDLNKENKIENSKKLKLKINNKPKKDEKAKGEEKKNELPPLPNIKIKEKKDEKAKGEEKKNDKSKNKSFKMDNSFLKND